MIDLSDGRGPVVDCSGRNREGAVTPSWKEEIALPGEVRTYENLLRASNNSSDFLIPPYLEFFVRDVLFVAESTVDANCNGL